MPGACLLLAGLLGGAAQAGFPGINGEILIGVSMGGVPSELWTVLPNPPEGQQVSTRLLTGPRLNGSQRRAACANPAYLPDGSRFLFDCEHRHPGGGRIATQLYSATPSGRNKTALGEVFIAPKVQCHAGFPALSPTTFRQERTYIAHLEGGPEFAYEVRVERTTGAGNTTTLLWNVQAGRMVYAPDGRALALVRGDQICLVAGEPAQVQQLTQPLGGTGYPVRREPTWFPDGTRMIFSQKDGPDAPWKLWWMRPDGTQAEPFTFGPDNDTAPEVSPDGLKLVYVSDRTGSQQLHLRRAVPDGAPAPGPEDEVLTHFCGGTRIGAPTWRSLPLVRAPRAKVSRPRSGSEVEEHQPEAAAKKQRTVEPAPPAGGQP